MKFILGHAEAGSIELTQYSSQADACFDSEEWVIVEADNLEEAKEKYEQTFLDWQNSRPSLPNLKNK